MWQNRELEKQEDQEDQNQSEQSMNLIKQEIK